MSEQDAEIAALRDVAAALEPLDGDMRLRVLNWARQRFVTDPSLDALRSQLGLRKPTREVSDGQ